MGSEGNVVNLVVGKEVTSISGQFQKTYIGTPTAKLSLTLEEGSKLSSIGTDAFKNNTFFVSIDLSNAAQDMTLGNNAFNNLTSLHTFKTGTGVLTLGTDALSNLSYCENFDLNSKTTSIKTDLIFSTAAVPLTYTSKTNYRFYATGWANWTRYNNYYYNHANSATITLESV